MKKIYNIVLIALAASVMASCVKDLDALPLNETDKTSETAYADESSYLQGLAYINAYYSFVSQEDPGNSDLDFDDAGMSELLRQYLYLNELSTDAMKCIWGDPGVPEVQYNKLVAGAEYLSTEAEYDRCMKGIVLANEYLLQTTDEKLSSRGHSGFADKVHQYRAEARFHRAMFYYFMMDFFGNPPFALPENIGGEMPEQISRADLFNWLETELLDLANGSEMPEKGEVEYPRPTKGSVMALLARMYLNAEVYTGTAQWQKAKDAAKAVIDMGYTLHDNYQELFMEDNSTNGATEEFIFAIDYDKDNSQSYGSTTTWRFGALGSEENAKLGKLLGFGDAPVNPGTMWNGFHVADDYVARFNLQDVDWSGEGFGYNRETSDKRAFFINNGKKEFLNGNDQADTGWRCWKWAALRSDGSHVTADESYAVSFSSSDFAIFRLAEMYLIYAEADARLHGGVTTDPDALSYIKALRDRAGVGMPEDVTLDWLLDERARELMWEGHRRVDLIRYGYFTSASFPWTLKGGVASGTVSIPSYMTIYPLIQSDLNANSNLVQNPGY